MWTTETETETTTIDATTTVESVSTKETTIYVTVTRDATDDTTFGEETKGLAHKVKRTLPSGPLATQRDRSHARLPVSKTQQPINIRPVESLDALAEGLARRGVPIQRRATPTTTIEQTEEATTTIIETETETEWTTEYTTSVTTESHTVTVIAYKGSKTTITLDKAEGTGDSVTEGPGSGLARLNDPRTRPKGDYSVHLLRRSILAQPPKGVYYMLPLPLCVFAKIKTKPVVLYTYPS